MCEGVGYRYGGSTSDDLEDELVREMSHVVGNNNMLDNHVGGNSEALKQRFGCCSVIMLTVC